MLRIKQQFKNTANYQLSTKILWEKFKHIEIKRSTAEKILTYYKSLNASRDAAMNKFKKDKNSKHTKNKDWWSEPWQQEHQKSIKHYNR